MRLTPFVCMLHFGQMNKQTLTGYSNNYLSLTKHYTGKPFQTQTDNVSVLYSKYVGMNKSIFPRFQRFRDRAKVICTLET